jgi:hypothetical protein
MCMGYHSSPPHGIPIPEEVHEQYSEKLKAAWITFHTWWSESDQTPRQSDMPKEVKEAMDLILVTPIPGYEKEGYTGKDSCYMIGVQMMMLPD